MNGQPEERAVDRLRRRVRVEQLYREYMAAWRERDTREERAALEEMERVAGELALLVP